MAYKDPMLELFAGLPQLLMQYKMESRKLEQSEEQFQQQMALREKELGIQVEQNKVTQSIDLLKYGIDAANDKYDSYEQQSLDILNSIDAIETEMSVLGPGATNWSDRIEAMPDEYKTSGGQQMPDEFKGNIVKSYEWRLEENERRKNEEGEKLESLRAQEDWLTDEFAALKNLKEQSSQVKAWTAPQGYDPSLGSQTTIDKDDLRYYFETELTYDGSDEGKAAFRAELTAQNAGTPVSEDEFANKWNAYVAGKYDTANPDYEDYKELFASWDPGDEADRALTLQIGEQREAHRKGLDEIISDTYSGIKATYDAYATEWEGSSQDKIWGEILSMSGTNEAWDELNDDEKAVITTWLTTSLDKQGGAQEWYDALTKTDEGRVAYEWLRTNPQFEYRIGLMDKAVGEYNDPFTGQGTTKQQITIEQYASILDDTVDPSEIYKKFVGVTDAQGMDRIQSTAGYNQIILRAEQMANDYSNDLNDKQRNELLDLDNILNDYIYETAGKVDSSIRVYDREIRSLEIEKSLATNQGDIERIDLEINEYKGKKRDVQTGAMLGSEEKEDVLFDIGTKDDMFPEGARVSNILNVLDDPELMVSEPDARGYGVAPGSGFIDQPYAGYEYGRDNPHDITSLKESSQILLDDDENPYVQGYDDKAKEIWDIINVEVKAEGDWGADPFGPDFLHYMDQHPQARLERALDMGVINEEQYTDYVQQMKEAGDKALSDRLNEIMDNPQENKEDYRELINVITKSKDEGKLQEALDSL